MIQNKCGWFAEDKEDLQDVLLRVINNKQDREQILEKAKIVAKENHSFEKNAESFQSILCNAH